MYKNNFQIEQYFKIDHFKYPAQYCILVLVLFLHFFMQIMCKFDVFFIICVLHISLPRPTLSDVASLLIQNPTQLRTTISVQGTYT